MKVQPAAPKRNVCEFHEAEIELNRLEDVTCTDSIIEDNDEL